MIDWDKSAELNNKTIIELKLYLKKFPGSNKKVCRICDICGRTKWLSYSSYVDICRLCILYGRKIKDPVCNVCGNILIIDKNWTQHRMKISDHRCNNCVNEYGRKQYTKNREAAGDRMHHGKSSRVKTISKYIGYDNITGKQILWRQKIDEFGFVQGIGSFQAQTITNRSATRRGFGFTKLGEGCDDCDWHHVTKDLVVAVPRSVHRRVRHKLGDGNMIEGLIG